MVAANHACKAIVDQIGLPIYKSFVSNALASHITGNQVSLSVPDLINFLMDDFIDFAKGMGNGLVSIAGTINELLLIRAMQNAMMKKDYDFKKTGTKSEGDVIVHAHAGSRVNLGVEIKSYRARERLLRGLTDISGLKVGAGFFVDPAEFNYQRTVTLTQAKPAAIYMPNATLVKVSANAQAAQTQSTIAYGSRLYRPLERFVTDMKHYNATGALPRF